MSSTYLTTHLINCINTNTPVLFSKYGDGEYNCANFYTGSNCDLTRYTPKLGNDLISAFTHVSAVENSYIGLWHNIENIKFWEKFATKPIQWANYHSILISHEDMTPQNENLSNKIALYKTIKESKLKKIVVCNILLQKIQPLLNIDDLVFVDINNWYESEFNNVINHINELTKDNEQFILLTCCGMAGKIVISELNKLHPKGLFLDCGSAFDFICTKRDSRGNGVYYTYEDLCNVMKELLPPDWENDKYNEIYNVAKHRLGVHLR